MKVLVVKRFYLIFINQTFKSNNFSLNILCDQLIEFLRPLFYCCMPVDAIPAQELVFENVEYDPLLSPNELATLRFVLENTGPYSLLSSYESAVLDMTLDNVMTDLLEVDMDEHINPSPTPKLFTVSRVMQGESPEYFKDPRVASTSFKDFKIITSKLQK